MQAAGKIIAGLLTISVGIVAVAILAAPQVPNRFVLPDGSVVRFSHVVATNRLTIPFRGAKLLGVWSELSSDLPFEVFSNQFPALLVVYELTGKDAVTRLGPAPWRLKVASSGATNFQSCLNSFGISSAGPWFTRNVVIRADSFPVELANSDDLRIALEWEDPLSRQWRPVLTTNISFGTYSP